MDVCCDGIPADESPADDGRCETDPTYLSITAFQYLVEGYGTGQRDLDANVHPYVVFGNTAEEGNEGWPTFDPQAYGIEPLSLMAVVCGDKLVSLPTLTLPIIKEINYAQARLTMSRSTVCGET